MLAYMYICVHICILACIYACMHAYLHIRAHICIYASIYHICGYRCPPEMPARDAVQYYPPTHHLPGRSREGIKGSGFAVITTRSKAKQREARQA